MRHAEARRHRRGTKQPLSAILGGAKEGKRWYYVDIEAALDPNVDREDAIRSVPADRVIRTNFGRDVELDVSTPDKEYEAKLFPLAKAFDHYDWRSGNAYWQYQRSELWDRFEGELIRAFEHFQLPVIELKKETPKEAVCPVFEKVNTGGDSRQGRRSRVRSRVGAVTDRGDAPRAWRRGRGSHPCARAHSRRTIPASARSGRTSCRSAHATASDLRPRSG